MDPWIEPPWLDILVKIGTAILSLSLLYVVTAYLCTTRTIYKTALADGTVPADTMAYYYLPAAFMKISALARVDILKDANGAFKDAVLKELSITATVEILPDTSRLLLIKYFGSSFANDDIKITTNSHGLLETTSSVAEDRLGNIISALFTAPSQVLNKSTAENVTGEPIPATIESKEYIKEFLIMPTNIRHGASNTMIWLIDVSGTLNPNKNVDASFKVDFDGLFGKSNSSGVAGNLTGDGIYVRPPMILQVSMSPLGNNTLKIINTDKTFVTVPDVNNAVRIDVSRTFLVKKTQNLKLQNGMLLENSVLKPSQTEAFITIPITILKSIFSIPAQLLSFKINHVQQQKNLITDKNLLRKAELESEKEKLQRDAELAKVRLDAQKTTLSYEQDIHKAKLETQKGLQESQKNILIAQKDVIKAQQDLLQQQHDLNELRKKLEPAG